MKKQAMIKKVRASILLIYFGVMLGFFPIYYKYRYSGMGDAKYALFRNSTIVFLCAFVLCLLTGCVQKRMVPTPKETKINRVEGAVLLYFISSTLSFFFSDYKKEAFMGSDGWNMGYLTLLLLVGVFFAISMDREEVEGSISPQRIGLSILLISSFLVFLIGVLHRFDLELLPIYGDLAQNYKIQFLSTMGQSSWYSSFLCTVWPLGLYLFCMEKRKGRRTLYGIYSAVGAMSLVTQNTDTAFLSLFAVLVLLFFMCQREKEGAERYLEAVLLILLSFRFMGLMQLVAGERMIPLETLSISMSQGKLTAMLFVMVTGICLILWADKRGNYALVSKAAHGMRGIFYSRALLFTILGLIVAGIFLTVLFIILNTTGYLYQNFHYENRNGYLYFDDNWGNLRGFSWKFAWNYYHELPFIRKLTGVGPDCFSAYYANIPEYSSLVGDFFGGLTLTNAHNEYLTKLINLGALGLMSYLSLPIVFVAQFLKKQKNNWLAGAFALITISYFTHNLFCYEQVCCTPVFFILIAIGNKLNYN